ALEARVHVAGPNGERMIAFGDFHRLPGNKPQLDNSLHPNEIVTAVELPADGFAKNYSYLKIRDRLSYAFGLLWVAAALALEGRVVRIDASEALRVEGVFEVLTHQNRPRMAESDDAWKDDVAPEDGSPFRPLYDDTIKFSGQPIALVLAQEWEIARYAASLVRIEYEKQAFVTDLHKERDRAFVVKKPEKPRGDAEKAYAAADVRHEADYFIPTEYHNPMELFASTVMWDGGGKLTVYDKTQGV